jgi:hypothetical protein
MISAHRGSLSKDRGPKDPYGHAKRGGGKGRGMGKNRQASGPKKRK